MKRFKVTNSQNGLQFIVEAEDLKMQPEYGATPVVTSEDITIEVIDREAKKLDRKNRIEALKGLKGKNLSNAEIQLVMQAFIKEMTGD